MDKKIKFLFVVSSIILIIVIFAINILIKRYEKEPLAPVSEGIEESVSKEETPVREEKEMQTIPEEDIESEPFIEGGMLLN